MEPVKRIHNAGRKKKVKSRYSNRYKPDFRLKVVKKYLEEGIPCAVLCKECGISDGTLYNWAKAYRREGHFRPGGRVSHGSSCRMRGASHPGHDEITFCVRTAPGCRRVEITLENA